MHAENPVQNFTVVRSGSASDSVFLDGRETRSVHLSPFARLPSRASSLYKFSCARKFPSGNGSKVFDVLAKQGTEFRENQPSVFVFNFGCEGTQMRNFVFETAGWHEFQPKPLVQVVRQFWPSGILCMELRFPRNHWVAV